MNQSTDKSTNRKPIQWSYDDPESCARAMEAMADDPEFIAEAMRVYRDFEFTMADGLDEEDWSEYLNEDGTLKAEGDADV
jgi:hypothetical protein